MGIFKRKKGGDDDIDEIIEEADKEVKPLDASGRSWEERPEQISNDKKPDESASSGTSSVTPPPSEAPISSKIKAEIDELKSKLAIVRDMEKDYGERFERITERLGNLAEGNRENEKSIHELSTKLEKIQNLVEDLDPRQIEIKLQKWESKLEQTDNNVESLTEKIDGLSNQLQEAMKKLSSFVGVEAFEKIKQEFEKDVTTAKQLDAKIEKNSNKVENMFLEVEEKYQDVQKLKSEFEKAEQQINEIKKEFDKINIKIEKYIKKDDIVKFEDAVNKRFAQIDDSLKKINAFVKDIKSVNLGSIKNDYPKLLKEFKDIKTGYVKLKDIVAEINNRLGKAVADFVEITDKEGIEKLKKSLKAEVQKAVDAANEVIENFKDSRIIQTQLRELQESVKSLTAVIDLMKNDISQLKHEDNNIKLNFDKELKQIRKDVMIDDDKILSLLRNSEHIKQLERTVRQIDKSVKDILNEDDEIRSFVSTELKRIKAEADRSKLKIDKVVADNEDILKRLKNLEPVILKKNLDKWRLSVDEDVSYIMKETKETKEFVNRKMAELSAIAKEAKTDLKNMRQQNKRVEKKLENFVPYSDLDDIMKLQIKKNIKDAIPGSVKSYLSKWQKELDRDVKEIFAQSDSMKRFVETEVRELDREFSRIKKEMKSISERNSRIERHLKSFLPLNLKKQLAEITNAINDIDISLNEFEKDIEKLKKSDSVHSRVIEEAQKKLSDLYELSSTFAEEDEVRKMIYEVNKRISKLNKYAYQVVALSKELELFKAEVLSKLSGSEERNMIEELKLLREIKQGLEKNDELGEWINRQIAKGYTPEQIKKILEVSNYDPGLVDEYLKV